jgi:hypothetical protein
MEKIRTKPKLSDVIEEIDMAYRSLASQSGSMNTDYAGFACMALGDFRDALQDQNLSCEDLQAMLRAGQKEHRKVHLEDDIKDDHKEGEGSDWPHFIASHVKRTANENSDA